LLVLAILGCFRAHAGGLDSAFETGRAYYIAGEFAKAAAQFQLVLESDPGDAEACYWTGMSYHRMADIATPFGGNYAAKARPYLVKAMQLAPGERLYRQALFDFLLDDGSRSALRGAADILRAMPESDPDYGDMLRRFESQRKSKSSVNARLAALFLAVPQAAYRIGTLAGPVRSSRSAVASTVSAE